MKRYQSLLLLLLIILISFPFEIYSSENEIDALKQQYGIGENDPALNNMAHSVYGKGVNELDANELRNLLTNFSVEKPVQNFTSDQVQAEENSGDDVRFKQIFPDFPKELIRRVARRYFERPSNIEGIMVAVQYGLKDQGEPLESGIEILNAIETIFARLEDTDVIGKLQSVTQKPMLVDSTGNLTFQFDSGRFDKPMTTIARLSVIFSQSNEAEKAAISIALGGRDYYPEAWAMLNRYKMSVTVSINSIFDSVEP